ncbi:PRC-barrel domain-containing protein [Solirubrobacter pauli]|nr:PRC-barrel domain-containing protein [Solirubrobacter pauli]
MAQLPTQSQFGDYGEWPGRDVLDSSGQRLGGVREIYLDRETGRPEWVLVDVDGSDARFVPLADASVESRSIRVAHTADKIKSAPGIGAEPRIDQSEERRLYAHYGLGYSEDDSGSGLPSTDEPPAPTGWGQKDEPAWQARGGETTTDEQDTSSWSSAAEPTIDAPPPAEPPSPAEIESAQIPDEPPAASGLYETAPFGAVAPKDEPTDAVDAPPLFAEPADDDVAAVSLDRAEEDATLAGEATTDEATTDAPANEATTEQPALEPADEPAALEPADELPALEPPADDASLSATDETADTTVIGDTSPLASDAEDEGPPVGALDSPPADAPGALHTPPAAAAFSQAQDPADAPTPPITADEPEAADSAAPADSTSSRWPDKRGQGSSPHAAPPEAASIPKQPLGAAPPINEEQGAAGGALERVKRDPKKVALAAVGAAVLFFIVRRLR